MNNSQNWSNYAAHNQHMANTDQLEADRRYHEQERQRAEDRARQERAWEEQQRREADRRRNR